MSVSDSGAEISHPGLDDEGGTYEEWVGRIIDDRYRVDGLLGEGGMGAVFEAEHLKLMKKVALKVIHPEFAGDGEVAKRFVREAMASARLEHPHVASATDYGVLPEGGAYLVMQYVRGESVRDRLDRSGGLGWVQACEIVAQVADALSSAHKAGIVHRDLKPDNVMLEPRDDGTFLVKVLDFGIARVADEKGGQVGGQALTRVGTVIGTPGYMAPEQALGEAVDLRVDIYALGLLIYEVVTGEKVFESQDLTAIVTRQLTEDPPRLSTKAEGVPRELDDLVEAALSRKKEGRPDSAAAVRETLRGLVLGAAFQAVASGEHSIPISTTDLGGASRREPTPLGVPLDRPDPRRPPSDLSAKPRASGPVATARTQLAANVVEVAARARKVPRLAIAVAVFASLALIAGVAMLFSGDGLRKGEHGNRTSRAATPREAAPQPEPEGPSDPGEPIPDALAQPFADLLVAERRSTRRAAAQTILRYEPADEIPAFVTVLAQLERASRCRLKRAHVVRLGELADPRALPALERIDAAPRTGCRQMFRRTDCYGCLRDDLASVIESLRAEM